MARKRPAGAGCNESADWGTAEKIYSIISCPEPSARTPAAAPTHCTAFRGAQKWRQKCVAGKKRMGGASGGARAIAAIRTSRARCREKVQFAENCQEPYRQSGGCGLRIMQSAEYWRRQ